MNTLGQFFQKELNGESFSDALRAGELVQITVNRAERSARLGVNFPQLVEYSELRKLERVLEGPAFGLGGVKLLPHFPPELFSGDCVPLLVAALKERDATLNGTFNQAKAVYQSGKLTIHLAHGGYELLAARNTGAKLESLIQEWFQVSCAVEFAGRLSVDAGEGTLVEKARNEQVRRQREAEVREMEEYEEALQERAQPPAGQRAGRGAPAAHHHPRDGQGRAGPRCPGAKSPPCGRPPWIWAAWWSGGRFSPWRARRPGTKPGKSTPSTSPTTPAPPP